MLCTIILLLRTRVVSSWSLVPAPAPAAPTLVSSEPSALIRQSKSFKSFLISSSIIISCQFFTLSDYQHAYAATLPRAISDKKEATATRVKLSSSATLLSTTSSLESKFVSTSNNANSSSGNDNINNNSNGSIDVDLQKLQQSLSDPTDDRPQIQMPPDYNGKNDNPNKNNFNFNNQNSQNNQNNQNEPLLQGMVYLLNQNDRPDYSDTIVITVSSATNPELTIAGAKYSVSKARFPFQFRLYRPNILNQELVDREIKDKDLMVMARICPNIPRTSTVDDGKGAKIKNPTYQKNTNKVPCDVDDSIFLAKGISKVVGNLPGMTEGTVLRTAASLPLERRVGRETGLIR